MFETAGEIVVAGLAGAALFWAGFGLGRWGRGPRPAAHLAPPLTGGVADAMMAQAPAVIFAKDRDGRYLFANHDYAVLAQRPGHAILGRTDHEIFEPEFASKFRRDDLRALKGGPLVVEESLQVADKKHVFVSLKFPLLDPDGLPIGTGGISTEITRLRESFEIVRERDALIECLVENFGALIYIKDLDGRYILVNRAYESVLGLDRAQILGRSDAELFSGDEAGEFQASDEAARRDGQAVSEICWPRNGGDAHYLNVKFLLKNDVGHPYALCCLATDITEQKRAEQLIRQSERTFRHVLDLVPHPIFAVDAEGTVLIANLRCIELAGQRLGHRVGEEPGDFYAVARQAVTDAPHSWERRWRGDDAAERIFHTTITPFKLIGMHADATLVVSIEITELKRVQDRLTQHEQALEALVEARTTELRETQERLLQKQRLADLGKLVATVGHELRNPMGTVRGSLFLIDRHLPERPPLVDAAIARAGRNITRCDQIIEDMLDFTRIQILEKSAINLRDWLWHCIEDLNVPPGVGIDLNVPPHLTLRLDAERMRRCVINLLNNAVQAVEAAGVGDRRIRIEAAREGADDVCLRIVDSGAGLSPDACQRAFEPLFSTKSFGVGLGLPLVRQIVEAHGGKVWLEPNPDQGATAAIVLPAGTGPA